MTWWRDSRAQTRVLLAAFGFVALGGMLIAGSKFLVGGDVRQLVVTMSIDVTAADRAALKADCGSLPGIGVVADKGPADRQVHFPVRFSLRGADPVQEAALQHCIDGHRQTVRGYITEGSGD